jgi:pantoate--beta-alanine ligase
MRTVRTIAEVRQALRAARGRGPVGLVPTMGALHDGHVALMRRAREECATVVVSLFVNPTQFGDADDLDSYPRELERDLALADGTGADLLFAPAVEEMYPEGFQTWVDVEDVSKRMEGVERPGHFRAVATVCLKLFTIVRPDRAYFGQKDAQQIAVVERMVRDLALELEVHAVPTVRDTDGLALSSRNVHLTPEQRQAALSLPRALAAGREAYRDGAHADAVARTLLLGARSRGVDIDYVETALYGDRLVLAGAIRVGSTRLIDNVILEGELD